MANTIKGIVVEIGGDTSGLSKALNDVDKNLKATQSELTAVDKALKFDPDNVKMLTQQQDLLTEAIDETSERLKLLEENQEKVDKAFAANAEWEKQYEPIRKQIEETSAALDKLKSQQKKFDEQHESGKISAEKYDAFYAEIEKTQKSLNALKKEKKELDKTFEDGHIDAAQYREYQREVEMTRSKLDSLNSKLDESKNAAKKAESGIDDLGEEMEDAGKASGKISDGFTVAKGALADLAADGIKAAVEGFKELAVEGQKASDSFQAQTGASAAEMAEFNKQIGELYSENYGEDLEDIADAMAHVKQNSKETDPGKIKELTEQALILQDTFEFDVNETMRAANMLMDQFGVSGDEAFNLIVQGAQNGLNKNGDLLDSINEYSVHYKQLGYTAEDFFNSLANGTAAGTFSVDKLGDAMKEFGIRTKDTSATTSEGFELIGLDADKMRESFAQGGDVAQAATARTLKALFEMDDAVKQNQAGVDLFGTMWEDLGIDGVKALTNVTGSADKTADSLENIKKIKYSDTETRIKGLGRTVKTEILKPVADDLLPVVENGVEWTKKNLPLIKNLITDIAVGAVTWKITTGIISAGTAVKAFTVALKEGKTASDALNLSLEKNPLALIATAAITAGTAIKGAIDNATEAIDETSDAYDLLDEKQRNVIASCDELTNSIENNRKQREDSSDNLNAQLDVYSDMRDRLYELDDAEKISNEEKAEMKTLVDQLNLAIPDLNLKLDNQTGHLKNQREEVDKLIDSYIEQAKAEASQEALAEMYQDLYKAKAKVKEVTEEYNKAQKKQKELQEDFQKLTSSTKYLDEIAKKYGVAEDSANKYMECVGVLQNAIAKQDDVMLEMTVTYANTMDPVNTLTSDIEDMKDVVGENAVCFEDAASAAGVYGPTLETATANTANNTAAVKDNTAALGDQNAALENTAVTMKDVVYDVGENTYAVSKDTAERIQEIADSYNSMLDERTESIYNSLDLFQQFSGGAETSAADLISALDSQQQGVQNWADNLEELAKRGVSDGLIKELEEAGPSSANKVAAMCSMTDEQLKNYSDSWENTYKLCRKVAEKQLQKTYDKSAEQIQGLIEQAGDYKVPMEDAYRILGRQCSIGFSEGMRKEISSAEAAAQAMVYAAKSAAQKAADSHSPSRVFRKLGTYVPQGYALGMDDERKKIYKSAVDMVNEVVNATRNAKRFSLIKDSGLMEDIGYINANMARLLPKRSKNSADESVDIDSGNSQPQRTESKLNSKLPERAVFNLNIDGQTFASAVAPFLDMIYGTEINLASRGR